MQHTNIYIYTQCHSNSMSDCVHNMHYDSNKCRCTYLIILSNGVMDYSSVEEREVGIRWS